MVWMMVREKDRDQRSSARPEAAGPLDPALLLVGVGRSRLDQHDIAAAEGVAIRMRGGRERGGSCRERLNAGSDVDGTEHWPLEGVPRRRARAAFARRQSGLRRRLEAWRLAFKNVFHPEANQLSEAGGRQDVEAIVADRLEGHLGDLG